MVYGISASPTSDTTPAPTSDSSEGDAAIDLTSMNAVYAALFAAVLVQF